MRSLVPRIREVYATGEVSITALTAALGGETKHLRVVSQVVRGERYPEMPGPIVCPDFEKLAWYVEPMRLDYAAGRSVDQISRTYEVLPLVARRILSGMHYRYLPGPLARKLRTYPNDPKVLDPLEHMSDACEDWQRVLFPQRFVDRPDPVWLREDKPL